MTQHSRGTLLSLLLVAVLACLPFLPGLPGGFVFDDGFNIVENPWVHLESLSPFAVIDAAFSPQPGGMTRVLPTLSFALDYFRGGGLDPLTFKTTNIAIHGLTVVALALFLHRLLLLSGTGHKQAVWLSAAMATAWAVHPLQVSSVLYVVQRMQTMSTLFLLLALSSYLKGRQAQMAGDSGRTHWMAAGLLWMLAVACKEDAALLPAYTLVLELTVLRFGAADPALARKLRRGYAVATALGSAAYLLIVIPHYWAWGNYAGRDFSSYERLLSQARILCMYLWQIVLPLPSHMPFYYDGFPPSRGLLQPWTTLPALLLLGALLGTAWQLRHRRPLFALGIFLFFAGHFITSNVVGLELAFEHRNHLPLIGIVLAVADLLSMAANRVRLASTPRVIAICALLAVLAGTTAVRAHSWRSELSLAQTSTGLAPTSARAWNDLCVAYFNAGGGLKRDNPNLGQAADACNRTAELNTQSVVGLVNVLTYKSLLGTVTDTDWNRFLSRLGTAPLKTENANSIWVLVNNARRGVPLDENKLLDGIAIASKRRFFGPVEFASVGYFILGNTHQPERAYPYFFLAVQWSQDPSFAAQLIDDLRKEGRPAWADQLSRQLRSPDASGGRPR
ncbi:hypothetical protein [Thermomonas sp.]|uniref:hypothetical protein n=1 Tax=Thermomonas sp. TaxID=1971895 RepID=UPI0035AE4821